MADSANQVERAPAGNGTARPFQVRVNGELLRTKGGIARRFKTEAAAQSALDAADSESDPRPNCYSRLRASFMVRPASQVRRAA